MVCLTQATKPGLTFNHLKWSGGEAAPSALFREYVIVHKHLVFVSKMMDWTPYTEPYIALIRTPTVVIVQLLGHPKSIVIICCRPTLHAPGNVRLWLIIIVGPHKNFVLHVRTATVITLIPTVVKSALRVL